MKIFVSWSGDLGRRLADGLRSFLPSALPGAEPFFSSRDIRAGEIGLNAILSELSAANVGVILLTPESHTAPWVIFEAGFLQGSVFCTVMPLLCGVEVAHLTKHPIGQLQCTEFSKEGVRSLVQAINEKKVLGSYDSKQLDFWFDSAWQLHNMQVLQDLVDAARQQSNAPTPVRDQVAAAIIGQGDLATMNLDDLVKLLPTKGKGDGS